MSRILLCLNEKNAGAAAAALSGSRHSIIQMKPFDPAAGLEAAAAAILEQNADVALMDYWPEDAASVKLMQIATERDHCPEFIFIEAGAETTAREQMIMALNEGARAFLSNDFAASALVNYIERAVSGPSRLRAKMIEKYGRDNDANALEEQLGILRNRAKSFQKLIAHLLATPGGSQNRKTLVVSDSPYQMEMLKKILDDHNIPVLTASNPADGLSIALNERPRVIVSDLELEGQTGIEFCQAIKFTHKLIPCHFIICTANQDKIAKVLTPGNGVDDCLVKPSGQSDAIDFVSRVALGFLL